MAAVLAIGAASWSYADDWRAANDDVGAFTRGHVDILRWEQAQPAADAAVPAGPSPSSPGSLDEFVAAAMRARPDLLANRGMSALERAQMQVEARAFALEVERAWIRAVAARRTAAYRAQVHEVAQAAAELAQRMQRVGNWSAARQWREELTRLDAQAQWLAARHAVTAALADLARLLPAQVPGGSALPALDELARRLPAQLPTSMPAAPPGGGTASPWPSDGAELAALEALEAQALNAHPRWRLLAADADMLERGLGGASRQAIARTVDDAVAAAQGRWPATLGAGRMWPHAWDKAVRERAEADALERAIRADVRVAYSAWHTARALADGTLQDVQRLQAALEADMVQRYNGMLASTWDVLASARERVDAVDAAMQAQRDAWLADAELRGVLAGLPYTGSAPGAVTGASKPTAKGH